MSAVNILIVDDIATTRELLRSLILSTVREKEREEEVEIFQASTTAEAQKILSRVATNLVFLDIELPDISGLDLIDEIHSDYPQAKIVMVTGDSSIETVKAAIAKGVQGYIVKPFNAVRVAEALENCLAK